MRVCSTHERVTVALNDEVHELDFPEVHPGFRVADLPDAVAQHLLANIGQAGGFWTDHVATEDIASDVIANGSELSEPKKAKKKANVPTE